MAGRFWKPPPKKTILITSLVKARLNTQEPFPGGTLARTYSKPMRWFRDSGQRHPIRCCLNVYGVSDGSICERCFLMGPSGGVKSDVSAMGARWERCRLLAPHGMCLSWQYIMIISRNPSLVYGHLCGVQDILYTAQSSDTRNWTFMSGGHHVHQFQDGVATLYVLKVPAGTVARRLATASHKRICCCSVKVTPCNCSGIMSPYERTGDIIDEGTEEIASDQ